MPTPSLLNLYVILAWLLLYGLLSGAGLLILSWAGTTHKRSERVLMGFWAGWALLIAWLQIWHLFLPVTALAGLPLLVMAVLGWWRARPAATVSWWRPGWQYVAIIGLGTMLLLASDYAIYGSYQFDDGLYHLQDVQWMTHYSIVPGLGNLHGRLAFNTSHTLFVALLDQLPLLPPARHISHGLLFLAFSLHVVRALWRIIRHDAGLDDVFLLLSFPALLFISTNLRSQLAGIKNDYSVLILGLLMSAYILRHLQRRQSIDRAELVVLALVAIAAVTVKISLFIIAGGLLLVLLWKRPRLTLLAGAGLFVAIIGVWLARGVILSGYPAYPVTLLAVPVDWRVPEAAAHAELQAITSFARSPGDPSLTDWLPVWWGENRRFTFEFIAPLGLVIMASGLLVLYSLWRRTFTPWRSRLWLLPLILLAALGYWFLSAPAVRFGWAIFWGLGASVTVISLHQLRWRLRPIVLGMTLLLLLWALMRLGPLDRDSDGFPMRKPMRYDSETLASGLIVNMPAYGNQCWDVPLPCTPIERLDLNLRARDPQNLGTGFFIGETD